MLVLMRRKGETLMIGDNATVTVLSVKGNQVRVGIDAPKTVAVHREEIYAAIMRGRQGASGDNPQGHAAVSSDVPAAC